MALGLAGEIEQVRLDGEGEPVPVPGLGDLLDRVEQAVRDACDTAVLTVQLARGDLPSPKADEACRRTLDAADMAELGCRRLAQLAFGVSACLTWSDRVERLDRAAVSVLHPPLGLGQAVPLVADGMRFLSFTREELMVEIAGAICRLLIDRGIWLALDVPGPASGFVSISVDPTDALVLRTGSLLDKEPPVVARLLADIGWDEPGDDHIRQRRWECPVNVAQPAQMALRTACDVWLLTEPSHLDVRVGLIDDGARGAAREY